MTYNTTLNNILTNFLRENEGSFIKASRLERLSQQYGYLAETGRRRLRELTQPKHRSFNPHIEKKEFDGVIYYRYIN